MRTPRAQGLTERQGAGGVTALRNGADPVLTSSACNSSFLLAGSDHH